ncbi:hypothetical protein IGI39_004036 [Enterococcus sp. AZ135]|uniref:hypothetical protein n=1 Tax=unclassified Enterococcus TaxID=2608891 RepID=UPI003F24C0D2
MNQIKFEIKGVNDDMFTINGITKIIAYPSESEISIDDINLDTYTSFKFFYSGYPDEQNRIEEKQLIVKTNDIIYMKIKD